MPIFLLDETLAFPNPAEADEESGILAVGGDLSPARLILAYSMGIFPRYDESVTPILWHSPAERFAMRPDDLSYGRSIRRAVKRSTLQIRYDTAFDAVVAQCASVPRHDQDGTWLNSSMQKAYTELFHRGYAHSAEAWLDNRLVGGAYGVTLGGVSFRRVDVFNSARCVEGCLCPPRARPWAPGLSAHRLPGIYRAPCSVRSD